MSDYVQSAGDNIRHCAFCLTPCTAPKMCSKCHKRSYCSRNCQTFDWNRGGPGQGHKDWCRENECGEEDVDWQVRSIPDKGLGIVAKRDLPAGYRIMVEHAHTDPLSHPAIYDLMPENGTMAEKFRFNAMCNPCGTSQWGVSLRISRLNHDCNANASIYRCSTTGVNIIYAHKDIKIGQEICISYTHPLWYPLFMGLPYRQPVDLNSMKNAKIEMRKLLNQCWQISCPVNCICKNDHMDRLILKAIHLHCSMENMIASESVDVTPSTHDKDFINIINSIPLAPFSLARSSAYDLVFDFTHLQVKQSRTIRRRRTLQDKLLSYANKAYEVQRAISPYCLCALNLKRKVDFAMTSTGRNMQN